MFWPTMKCKSHTMINSTMTVATKHIPLLSKVKLPQKSHHPEQLFPSFNDNNKLIFVVDMVIYFKPRFPKYNCPCKSNQVAWSRLASIKITCYIWISIAIKIGFVVSQTKSSTKISYNLNQGISILSSWIRKEMANNTNYVSSIYFYANYCIHQTAND